ncbi:MAG: hypothetical protein WC529_04105 [Candidatus Margulisiibacteriota bacterium]
MIGNLHNKARSAVRFHLIHRMQDALLRNNRAAGKALTHLNTVWQLNYCDVKDPNNLRDWDVLSRPGEGAHYDALKILEQPAERRAVLHYSAYHLGMNAEHIAPLPVLLTYAKFPNYYLVEARDLGPGLGSYLDHLGSNYSFRPYARRLLLGITEGGNGIFLTLNQVLNGCPGSRAFVESSGQRVFLLKRDGQIWGRRFTGSQLAGTRFSFFLPQQTGWTQEESGWNIDLLPPPLRIKYLPAQPLGRLAAFW